MDRSNYDRGRARAALWHLIRVLDSASEREGLSETAERAAKAWEFWTSGYDQSPLDVLRSFEDGAEGYEGMVIETGIPIYSKCEHHLADIFGEAAVAYLPDKKIVGLSKIVRVVEIFARRLQVQERMTRQIADALNEGLAPRGVAVLLRCRHMCMESRGVRASGVVTTTMAMRGLFLEAGPRAEFLAAAMNSHK